MVRNVEVGADGPSAVVSPRLPLLLALLIVLTGCSSTTVSDGPTPDTVTTPAPVPTDDLPENRIAPGVSPDGIVDAGRLRDAHNAYLSNRSFTRTSGTRYRFENGTLLYQTTFNRSLEPAAERQSIRRDRTGQLRPEQHYWEWANETLAVERIARSDSVRYHRRSRSDRQFRYYGGAVAEFLAQHDPEVAGKRQANGTTEYVLVVRNPSAPDLLDQVGANRTGPRRLVAVVSREGLVRSIRITARGTYRGEPIRVSNYFVVTDVGETQVDRPAWVDAALNATAGSEMPTDG